MTAPRRRATARPAMLLLGIALTLLLVGVRPAAAGCQDFDLGLDQVVPPAALPDQPGAGEDQPGTPSQPPESPPQLLPDASRQPRGFPIRLLDDLPAAAVAPLHWHGADWRNLGLGVLAVGVVSLVDEPVDRWFDDHRNAGADQAAKAVRPLGQEGGLILLGATWLGGHFGHSSTLEAIGADGLEASLISALLVYPLKAAFGRERPRETQDHWSFWSGGESFPSGEAAQAFTVASVVAAHSNRTWVKVTAWGLAGLVGVERMELDAHWASDVVAGALIGTAVGHWVVKHNRPEREGGRQVTVAPMIGAQGYGVAMSISF